MARPRFPAPSAIFHIALRAVSLALCLAALCAAGFASAKYGYGRGMIGTFVAVAWTMIIDSAEVAALLDSKRRLRRCTEGYLVCLDFLTLLICGVLPIMTLLAFEGISHECGGRPWEECRAEEDWRNEASAYTGPAWLLTEVVAGVHFLLIILSFVDLCARLRGRSRTQNLA